eukprot:17614-Heterococcus_DN1.PRE.3
MLKMLDQCLHACCTVVHSIVCLFKRAWLTIRSLVIFSVPVCAVQNEQRMQQYKQATSSVR